MTFAGKKLQDIYDSGSTRLSELEENSQSKLATKSEAHISERKESEQQSKMEVAAKAASVEEEIKKQAKETAERIKQVADTEKAATQAHLNTMIERLSSFTSELKRAIEDLKTSYETGLEDNFVRAADHYSSGAEGVCQEIEDQHYQSGQKLRSQSSFYANSLQQKLDHSLWESRGSEKQSNSQLFRNYMQKANSVESHFSGLMQKLSSDFQEGFDSLQAYSKESEDQLIISTEHLSEKIDGILTTIEKDINEIFSAARDSNQEALKHKFEGTSSQVEELSSDTGRQLRDELNELSSKLSQMSLQSNHALRKKCEDLKESVQNEMQSFRTRMTENVTESDNTRTQLAEAKTKVIADIRADLVTIRDGFEESLKRMMNDAIEDLRHVQEEVVTDMISAYDRSLHKVTSDSNSAKSEIETATRKLLELINQNKNQALEEITRAAGE
ncbi:MAG: hypothetical protein IPP97_19825 [Candidatus Obscuribacter sp.]|nr:hypothetical protein [Candidatus Obscuribacter sp.]